MLYSEENAWSSVIQLDFVDASTSNSAKFPTLKKTMSESNSKLFVVGLPLCLYLFLKGVLVKVNWVAGMVVVELWCDLRYFGNLYWYCIGHVHRETSHFADCLRFLKDLLSGTVGGATQLCVGHPLDTIKVWFSTFSKQVLICVHNKIDLSGNGNLR